MTTTSLTITMADTKRQCGDCTLCCKLLPMKQDTYEFTHVAATAGKMVEAGMAAPGSFDGMIPDFDKAAGKPCPHQTHHRGCKIYSRRPFGCRIWNCRWLVNDDMANMRRPDRARYVVDVLPDFVTMDPGDGSPTINVEVVQIWVDPKHPNAWRDPPLLAFLDRRGKEGKAALIRFNGSDAMTVFPPSMTNDGSWRERRGRSLGHQHRGDELFDGLARTQHVKVGA